MVLAQFLLLTLSLAILYFCAEFAPKGKLKASLSHFMEGADYRLKVIKKE